MYGPELTKATIAQRKYWRAHLQAVLREGVGIAPGGRENLYAAIGGLSGRIATLEASLA
jgi:hypothetical protein